VLSIIHGYLYSLSYNDDEYGLRIASNDYFVVFARNEGSQFSVMLAPFRSNFFCDYDYQNTNNYVLHVAVGRKQNASQLSFVYLYTNSTRGLNQKLGILRFSRADNNDLTSSCQTTLGLNEGERDVKFWNEEASEVSTMQVDPDGRFVYGFISYTTFIYDIENDHIEEIIWNKFLPSNSFQPHAVDIGKTNDQIQMAILAGYFTVNSLGTLPCVYLVRLDPPFNMTIVDNLTLETDLQHTVREDFSFFYSFDYTMSVSIHHETQKVLVGVTDMQKMFLLSFNSTNIVLLNVFPRGARSVAWLNANGTEAALLLTNVTTLPWTLSQIHSINVHATLYSPLWAYPNNQQTLVESTSTISSFLRMTSTYDNQLVVLTNKGYLAFIPASSPGYYIKTDDINAERHPLKFVRRVLIRVSTM
jgi:hypothetical protein